MKTWFRVFPDPTPLINPFSRLRNYVDETVLPGSNLPSSEPPLWFRLTVPPGLVLSTNVVSHGNYPSPSDHVSGPHTPCRWEVDLGHDSVRHMSITMSLTSPLLSPALHVIVTSL